MVHAWCLWWTVGESWQPGAACVFDWKGLILSSTIDVLYRILGGGFNPFEKYARQIGSFPQIGMKIKNI